MNHLSAKILFTATLFADDVNIYNNMNIVDNDNLISKDIH